MLRRGVQSERLVWQPKVDGLTRDVPITLYAGEGVLDSEAQQTQAYLGMGEERFAGPSTVRELGNQGLNAIAVTLSFHHLPCTPVNIERTLIEVPHVVAASLRQRAGSIEPPNVYIHSQGGGVLAAIGEAPELFDAIAAVSPVGLTPEDFGETEEEKRGEFMKRLALRNSLLSHQNPFLHPGNVPAGAEIVHRTLTDWLAGRIKTKLDYALEKDMSGSLARIVEAGNRVGVFAGEFDPLFTVEGYDRALGRVGLGHILHIVENTSHSSPLVPAGKKQLAVAADWIMSDGLTI